MERRVFRNYYKGHRDKTNGESGGRGNNRGKKGKDCQGTCIKDTWAKPKESRINVGGGDG